MWIITQTGFLRLSTRIVQLNSYRSLCRRNSIAGGPSWEQTEERREEGSLPRTRSGVKPGMTNCLRPMSVCRTGHEKGGRIDADIEDSALRIGSSIYSVVGPEEERSEEMLGRLLCGPILPSPTPILVLMLGEHLRRWLSPVVSFESQGRTFTVRGARCSCARPSQPGG